ncbi:MAG: RNA-binding S4 domain-containing protein [Pseudomonadota bacterium]
MDKWLWYARLSKTRGLASRSVIAGHVRVNSEKVRKPAFGVEAGDILTLIQGRRVRVVRILGLNGRRGPPAEARALYEELPIAAETAPGEASLRKGGCLIDENRRNPNHLCQDLLD